MTNWIEKRQLDALHDKIEMPCRKCGKLIIWTSMYGDNCKDCSDKRRATVSSKEDTFCP